MVILTGTYKWKASSSFRIRLILYQEEKFRPLSWQSRSSPRMVSLKDQLKIRFSVIQMMTNDELLPGFFLRVGANSISHFIPPSAQNGWWECIPTRDISRFGWVLSFWHNQHELKKSEILLGGATSSVFFFFLFPSKWLKMGGGEAKRGREKPVRREKSERGKGQWRKNNNEDEEKQRNKTEVLVLNKDLLVAYQINRP